MIRLQLCQWLVMTNDVPCLDVAAFRSHCIRSKSSSRCWSPCFSGWPMLWSTTTSWTCRHPLSNWTSLSAPLTRQRRTRGRPEESRQRKRMMRSPRRFCTAFWSTYTSRHFTPLARYVKSQHTLPTEGVRLDINWVRGLKHRRESG